MSELRLTTQLIVQLLGEPAFYTENPAFLYLRDQGLAAVQKYLVHIADRSRQDNCCEGGQDDRQFVAGPIQAFVRTVSQLQDVPSELTKLKNGLAQRLGYVPDKILIQYKDEQGRSKRLSF